MHKAFDTKYLFDYEKRIVSEYRKALNSIRANIQRIQEKADLNGSLSLSDRFRIARDKDLIKAINTELSEMGQRIHWIQKELQDKSFSEGYFSSAFDIDQQTRFAFSFDHPTFSMLPKGAIEALSLDERFLNAVQNLDTRTKASVKSAIQQGIIQGKSMGKISADVKESLGTATNNSLRIARTETQRAINAGAVESTRYAENNGVKVKKMWLATKDDRTRDTHREMDGQMAEAEGPDGEMYFKLPSGVLTLAPGQSGVAEEDINCRCTYIDVVEGYEPQFISTRNEQTGKSEVTEYKTYKQWYDAKVNK
jgi:SPP1 gp7 family putative phage head morphogenesis protein